MSFLWVKNKCNYVWIVHKYVLISATRTCVLINDTILMDFSRPTNGIIVEGLLTDKTLIGSVLFFRPSRSRSTFWNQSTLCNLWRWFGCCRSSIYLRVVECTELTDGTLWSSLFLPFEQQSWNLLFIELSSPRHGGGAIEYASAALESFTISLFAITWLAVGSDMQLIFFPALTMSSIFFAVVSVVTL